MKSGSTKNFRNTINPLLSIIRIRIKKYPLGQALFTYQNSIRQNFRLNIYPNE
jgi:hypothetical protein